MTKLSHTTRGTQKNATSVTLLTQAVQTINAVMAGVRDGLKGGLYVTLIAGQVVAPVVWALPDQSGYEAGNAAVSEIDISGDNMVIAQDNSRILLNWDSFNIAAGESVSFIQELNQLAINQVNGGSLSKIFGTLNADANIMLINPAGVAIYNGAIVNVGSLVVSGMTLDEASLDPDAINSDATGSFDFSFDEASGGLITVQDGVSLTAGNLILLGKQVTVDSDIDVGSGLFGAGAAGSAVVTFDDDGLFGFSLNSDLTSMLSNDAQVAINGAVNAGRVILTTRQAAAAVNNSINITDTITAEKIEISGDRILLGGSVASVEDTATTTVSQNLEISAEESLTISGASTSITAANHSVTAVALDVSAASSTFNQLNTASAGAVAAGGLTVSGLSSVTASSAALTTNADATLVGGSNNEISTNAINFSGVASADLSGQTLAGSTGTDTFTLTNTGLTANNIAVSNVAASIDTNGGNDVFAGANGAWELTGANGELKGTNASAFTFTEVANANLSGQSLAGSAGVDNFTLNGSALTANNIAITNAASTINAAGSDDTLTTDAASVSLTGANEAVTAGSYTFSDIEDVALSSGAINANAGDDTFTVTANNALTTAGIDFTGVASVAAGSGSETNGDTVDTTGSVSLVDSVMNALTTFGINFTGVENADLNGQTLAGSSGVDNFTLNGGALTANNIAITNAASTINAAGSNDTLTTDAASVSLTGTNESVTAGSYTFSDIEDVALSSGAINANAGDDTFTVTANNALTTAGIDFTGVASVAAGSGSETNGDTVDTTGSVSLVDSVMNALTTFGINFTGVENADLNGQTLAGSTGTDTFTLTNTGLTANNIAVSNVAASIDTNGGNDVFAGANGAWELTGANGELKGTNASAFTFTEVANANLSGQSLAGSTGTDTFTLTNAGLTANNIVITDSAASVDTNGGNDVFAGATGAWELTGTNGELKGTNASEYTFTDVAGANLSGQSLAGSAGTDTFTLTNAGLTANSIVITDSAASVDTNGGDDVFAGATGAWELTGASGELKGTNASAFTFTEVANADLSGQSLTGSAGVDNFTLNGSALTANNIAITNAASAINAGGENDTLTTDAASVSLTGANEAVTAGSYTFSDIEDVALSSGAINANAGDDTFTVTANNALTTAGIDFTGVASVAAGSGSETNGDTVDTTGSVSLVDSVMNALTTFGINFTGVENADLNGQSLAGSIGTDTFTLTNAGLTANNIVITDSAASIDTNGGNDVYAGATGAWELTGANGELKGTNASAFTFTEVANANLSGQSLAGSTGTDTFTLTNAGLTANNIVITDSAASVDTNGGSDVFAGATGAWELTGANGELKGTNASAFTFTEVANANLSGQSLAGSTGTDTFTLTNAGLTANNIVITDSAASVDTNGGNDVFAGANGAWELTGANGELKGSNASEFTFTDVASANLSGQSLKGSLFGDTFLVDGISLSAYEINFSNVNKNIDASDGHDIVVSQDGSVSGNSGNVNTDEFNFSDIEEFRGADSTYSGTDNDEEFIIDNGILTLTGSDTVFSGITSIDALGGNDSLMANGESVSLFQQAGEIVLNAIEALGITFYSIESVDLGAGTLSGSTAADTFILTNSGLTANNIAITNAASTIDANGGNDVFAGASSAWELTGTNGELKGTNASEFIFTDITNADLSGQSLAGSTGIDNFTLNSGDLTANSIAVTNVASTINAAGGNDTLTTDAASVSLTGTNESVTAGSYTFSDIEDVALSSGAINANAGDDTFTVTANNALTTAGIDFTGVASVAAGSGGETTGDTVNTTDGASLVDSVLNALVTFGIDFTGVENADLDGGTLVGSAGADSFAVNGTTLTANGIAVTGAANGIDAKGGSDSIDLTDSVATLTGADGQFSTSAYTFSAVETVAMTDGSLTGTSGNDQFNVTGDNAVTATNIDFTGVISISAGAGDQDSVTTQNAALVGDGSSGTGKANALSTQGISVTGIEVADLQGGVLSGSDQADTFALESGELSANGITFSNAASTIDMGSGSDSLSSDEAQVTLSSGLKELNAGGYTFQDLDSANLNSNELVGTAGDDEFTLGSSNGLLTSNGISFSDVVSVDAGEGSNDQVTTNNGDASLVASGGTATDNSLLSRGITFSGIETANLGSGTLSGSSEADAFVVNGTTLTANQIQVTSSSTSVIDGAGGDDTLSVNGGNATLTGTSQQIIAGGRIFGSVASVNLNSNILSGSRVDDNFDLTGTTLTANDIEISGANSSIDMGDGQDTLTTDIANVDLTGSDNELSAGGYNFVSVEAAELASANITANDSDDTFDVTGANSLSTAGINFTGVATVAAGSGSEVNGDTVETTDGVSLIDSLANALSTFGITFSGIENADLNGNVLSGSAGADSFTLSAGALSANGIAISDAALTINASGGQDSLTTDSSSVSLTGTDGELVDGTYTFSDIESAGLSSAVVNGSAADDTFTVTGANTMTASGIDFTGVASVDAGAGSETSGDTVVTSSDVSLVDSVMNALATFGISFTGIENADLNGNSLSGSASVDTFTLNSGELTANNIAVTNAATTINAAGGEDTLTTDVASVGLTGDEKSVSAGAYTFSDVENVALNSGEINANAGDDIFTVTAANALTTAGIDFTGVASVAAGSGSETDGDTVDTVGDVSLVDSVANALTTFGINFTDVENVDLNGNSLNGSAGVDAFTLNGSALTANNIAVVNAAATINAGDGRDTLSTDEAQVSLTGTDEELIAGSYTFADIETIGLSSGTVIGNASDDNFEVLDANNMTVARMEFTGVNQVVGGTGSETDGDRVSTAFDTSLVADTDFAISTGGITFTDVENADLEGATLSGSAGDDTFEVNGFELTANQVNFSDLNSTVNAGLGNDSVSATGEEISLDGTNGSMSTAQFQFTGVESSDLSGSVLNGSDGSDSFVIKGESSLDMNGIAFTGVTEVNAGGGNDQLDTDGNNASLLSELGEAVNEALVSLGITFWGIEEVDLGGGTLAGSDAADSFEATGTSLTANGMAFTNVAADINAGNGADILTTFDSAVTLAGVSEGINTSNFNFTEVESAALSTGTLNGSTAADVFTITGDNAISASGMTITGVANIVGGSGNDQVVTTNDGAALISSSGVAVANALAANDMRFDGIESVNLNAGTLQGTEAAESYAINGVSQSFAVNSMTFTNADSVNGGTGSDIITTPSSTTATLDGSGVLISGVKFDEIETVSLSNGSLVGTGGADTFSLSSAVNQVTSGSILFTGVSSVNGAGGSDSVTMSSAGSATLGSSGSGFTSSLINFSSVETLNLAGGVLTGAAANNEEFALNTSANSLSVNGFTVNNVATVNADASDTISGSTGQDNFVVKSDNTVAVNGITFDGPLTLKGGSGTDTLTSEIDTPRWVINGVGDSLNQVGDFVFSQFESLVNAVGDLDLATSLQLIFGGESASFGGGAMTLSFDGDNDVSVFSTFGSGAQAQAFGDNTSAAIRGSVTADELVILSFGDIELMTNVNLLSVTSVDGQSINASIVQNGDLVIRNISIEDGVLILDSLVSGTGTITAETVNTVDVSALSAHIGSGKSGVAGAGQWASIGANGEQLTFEVQIQLDLTAISFVTPFFPTISPLTVNKEGNETDSLISSQNSAVIIIGGIGDVTQLNPAVFEALSPFIADANAVSGSSSHTGTDVPSTLDTEQLAVLLAAYEPTAAGAAEDYSVDGTSEEEGEEEKAEQEFVDDGQGDISVSLSPDNEVVGLVRNYRFRNGDSLWSLAQRFLGTGFAWNKLLEQNPAIDNPSAIADGTVIKVITTVDEEQAAQIQALIDSGVGVKDGANIILPEQYRDQLELR